MLSRKVVISGSKSLTVSWFIHLLFNQKPVCLCFMLMRDANLKQRIPCIIHVYIFGAVSRRKCIFYTGKYSID